MTQQTRAIGIRMAPGATRLGMLRLVLAFALRRVGLGVGIGGLLVLLGTVAALLPAQCAARGEPLVALRSERGPCAPVVVPAAPAEEDVKGLRP